MPTLTLTVLGSGTQLPSRRHPTQSALLLEIEGAAGTERVLLDCGAGAQAALARLGLTAIDIDRVVLTHFHPDHTVDLPALLFARQHPSAAGRAALVLHGPPGTEVFYERLQVAWPGIIYRDPGALRIQELEGGPHQLGHWTLSACPTAHTAASQGYRIEVGRCSLAYTGDTGPCDALGPWAAGVHVLVTEGSLSEGAQQPGHLTPSQAGELAQKAGCRMLLLTHLAAVDTDPDPTLSARETFDGPIRLAQDGMKIVVEASGPRVLR